MPCSTSRSWQRDSNETASEELGAVQGHDRIKQMKPQTPCFGRLSSKTLLLAGLGLLLVVPTVGVKAQQRGVERETVSRFVSSNREQRIWTDWHLGNDCQVVRGFNVALTEQPAHGTIEMRRVTATITSEWARNHRLNARTAALVRKCQGTQLPVISIFYKPNSGFVGFDRLKLRTVFISGWTREVDFRLAVR
jgi:hypothetical protein